MQKKKGPIQDKLGHLPRPPPLEPAGLPTGYYKGRVPNEVMRKHARLFSLGPLLMKPKRDHFVAMVRSLYVTDARPCPYRFNIFKAQTERYYRELDQLRQMRAEEDDAALEEIAFGSTSDPDQMKWARMKEENSRPCVAYMQGISPEGHTASIEVREFKPYFFVKLARSWTEHQIERFVTGLERKCVLKPETLTAKLVPRKDLFLFHPDPKDPSQPRKWKYICVYFPNMAVHNRAASKMKDPLCIKGVPQTQDVLHPEEVFRGATEHAQRIIDQSSIKPEGWIIIHRAKWRFASKNHRVSTAPYEIFTSLKSVHPLTDEMEHPLVPSIDAVAPTLLDSWDIECVRGANDGEMPDPEVPGDVCFMVCHSFAWMGSVPPHWTKTRPEVKPGEVFLRVGQVLGKTKPVDGMIVEEVVNEIQIVQRMRDWAAIIMDVDVLSAYNGDRFDVPFMVKKAQRFGAACGRFFYMSRIIDHKIKGRSKALKSGALGDNELYLIDPVGRHTFDTFQYVKSNAKLDQYSLNFVATTYLKKKKHDVNFRDIFKAFRSTPEDLHKILAYCGQDCDLPVELIQNRMWFINLVEMARVTLTQSQVLLTSGQQVKVLNQLMHYAHADGYVINMLYSRDYATTDKYGGGTVLAPDAGYHTDPTVVLDFKSLYPSIMMAHNLCYSTLVSQAMWDYINTHKKDYFERGLKIDEYKTAGGIHRFVDNGLGILPKILKTLGQERGKAKKLMANAATPLVAGIMNGRQLSLKVSMNSIYGFTGVKEGKLPCRPIAETVTCLGGNMIMHCKDCMEKWYPGTKVIYGDSVAPWCPVLTKRRIVQKDGKYEWLYALETIDKLASRWLVRRDGKQYGLGFGIVWAWSDGGWTRIHQVIRHTYKGDLYRVGTGRGIVDVTSDHSLVNSEGVEVKPVDVSLGTSLMHKAPPQKVVDLFQTPEAGVHFAELDSPNRHSGWEAAARRFYSGSVWRHATSPEDTTIQSLTSFPYSGFVYDLTTANHHFQAGIGDMIVHNTDSVMVKFPKTLCPTAVDAFELGFKAGDRLTAEFKPPIEMEMEKIYQPYLLKKRKYYAGKIYESVDQVKKYMLGQEVDETKKKVKEPYVDIKGIKPARRDNCALMRNLCSGILNTLFAPGDMDSHLDTCVDMVGKELNRLQHDEVAVEDLVITGGLKSSYAQTIPPHAAVGRRFNYDPGDRVPFVICDVPEMDRVGAEDKRAKRKRAKATKPDQGQKKMGSLVAMTDSDLVKASKTKTANIPLAAYARHPDEIKEGKYKPDAAYYVEKQLTNALEIVLGFVDRWPDVQEMLRGAIRDAKGKQQGLQKITNFMVKLKPPSTSSQASKTREPKEISGGEKPQKRRRQGRPKRPPKLSKKEKEDRDKAGMQCITDFF